MWLQVLRHESATSAVGNPNKKPRAQATPGPRGQAARGPRAQATPGSRAQATPGLRGHATLGPRGQATLGPRAQAPPSPRAQATPVGSALDPITGLPLWFSPGTGNSASGSASASKALQKRPLKTERGDQSCVSVLMPCLSTNITWIECPVSSAELQNPGIAGSVLFGVICAVVMFVGSSQQSLLCSCFAAMSHVCMRGSSGKARVCVLCAAAFKLVAVQMSQGGLCLSQSVVHTHTLLVRQGCSSLRSAHALMQGNMYSTIHLCPTLQCRGPARRSQKQKNRLQSARESSRLRYGRVMCRSSGCMSPGLLTGIRSLQRRSEWPRKESSQPSEVSAAVFCILKVHDQLNGVCSVACGRRP